jgi:hypothetical protein
MKPVLIRMSGYLVSVLLCKYMVGFLAVLLAKVCLRASIFVSAGGGVGIEAFYAGNWLIFNIVAGILAGFVMYSPLTSAATGFVWLPFLSILIYKMYTYPQSVLSLSRHVELSHFVSKGCAEISVAASYISPRCADQALYSLPLYAAIGFSLGYMLRFGYRRRKLQEQ